MNCIIMLSISIPGNRFNCCICRQATCQSARDILVSTSLHFRFAKICVRSLPMQFVCLFLCLFAGLPALLSGLLICWCVSSCLTAPLFIHARVCSSITQRCAQFSTHLRPVTRNTDKLWTSFRIRIQSDTVYHVPESSWIAYLLSFIQNPRRQSL